MGQKVCRKTLNSASEKVGSSPPFGFCGVRDMAERFSYILVKEVT